MGDAGISAFGGASRGERRDMSPVRLVRGYQGQKFVGKSGAGWKQGTLSGPSKLWLGARKMEAG